MGTLPTETVAGKYYSIYDAYYKQVDPTNKGSVGAIDAAKFLKTSGLSDVILSKIWDLADSNGKGFLTRSGFFVAIKLVALVQAGKEPTTGNLSLDVPPPRMGDSPLSNKVPQTANKIAVAESEWAMKPTEKMKYDQLFDSLNPANGYIPGSKVKGLLMDSKLPLDTLGKIWDLADMDKDGALDRHEFSVAMHLVYKALEKYAIPSSLPPELLPPGKKKDSIPGAIQVLPAVPNGVASDPLKSTPLIPPVSAPPVVPALSKPPLIPPGPTPPLIPAISAAPLIPPVSSSPIPPIKPNSTSFIADNLILDEPAWVISKEEKIKYDTLFEQADLDRDGFVSGHEIKEVFLKSGVAQPVLAHIWGLCDTAEQGKLNNEQFALALWLISRKLKGIDPPPKLTQEMIPPSCRKPSDFQASEPAVFTSPEVTRLSKEIEELVKEKLALEYDITQREADIKIKSGEVKSLQGELDALVATLKQLENQKGEAMKRINDLKAQTAELESKIDDIKSELELEQIEVDKLRHQAEEQEKNLRQQESELNKKKQELDSLKKEEATLKEQREDLKNEIANITKSAGDTDEIIVEIKEKLIELEDIQSQLKDAISHLDNVLESKNLTSLSEVYLHVEPKFRSESYAALFSKIFKITGQNAADPFSNEQGNSEVDFSKTDAFANDPFAGGNAFKSDPFGSKDPFQSNKTSSSGFAADPFTSFDSGKKPDPFAASSNPPASNTQANDEDPFGCDPFAILHAPPKPGSNLPSPSAPRAESPSPALPPKKSKQPPPRPAPPRPAPLSLPSGFDSDFADFSSFSHKPSGYSSSTSIKSDHSKADPFRDYRYDDPFEMADESTMRGASAPPMMDSKSAAFDPFMSNTPNGFSKSSTPVASPLPPEDQQLAWATAESVRSEKERRKRAEQEKADYKLALKLSKQEGKKRSFRSKILP